MLPGQQRPQDALAHGGFVGFRGAASGYRSAVRVLARASVEPWSSSAMCSQMATRVMQVVQRYSTAAIVSGGAMWTINAA